MQGEPLRWRTNRTLPLILSIASPVTGNAIGAVKESVGAYVWCASAVALPAFKGKLGDVTEAAFGLTAAVALISKSVADHHKLNRGRVGQLITSQQDRTC